MITIFNADLLMAIQFTAISRCLMLAFGQINLAAEIKLKESK